MTMVSGGVTGLSMAETEPRQDGPTWFLRVAIGLTTAIGGLHGRWLIHKDVTPAHALLNPATGQVRLMGFGIASRLPREAQLA